MINLFFPILLEPDVIDDASSVGGGAPETDGNGEEEEDTQVKRLRSENSTSHFGSSRAPRAGSRGTTGTGIEYYSSAPNRALTLLPLLPVLAAGTSSLAIPGAGGAVGSFSLAATTAWYLVGTSVFLSAAKAAPVLVDVAIHGVEEVVEEVVEASRRVIRCISIGIMFIAAIAVVRAGYWILAVLVRRVRELCPQSSPKNEIDPFRLRYGGRLLGGGRCSSGPSVKELFGGRSRQVAPKVTNQGQVDPSKLNPGDVISFIYGRGSRAGTRRSAKLVRVEYRESGALLVCEEFDSHGVAKELKYWPSHTSETIYAPREVSPLLDDGDSPTPPRDADVRVMMTDEMPTLQWPASGAHETHWPDPETSPSRIQKAKMALYSSREDDWKALKEWKESQRSSRVPLQLENGPSGGE